ncbi:MAG: hypothetical protein E7099_09175 [Mediterranea massiliensis]|nr:hypothetical protein [Mediterranea massiliensis]
MKKFLKAALLAVVVAVAGYGAYEAQCKEMQLSETMLANVEALARYELPDVVITCGEEDGYCWVKAGNLCMKGEYSDFDCIRDSNPHFYCVTMCR